MARTSPAIPDTTANRNKTWTPDTPLKPDWNKVLEKGGPDESVAEKLERAANPLLPRGGSAKHPRNPAHQGAFSRQKKG